MEIAIIIIACGFSILFAVADVVMLFTIYYDWIIGKQPLFNAVITIISGIIMLLILAMCWGLFYQTIKY